jgi:hypothetical protein
LIGRLLSLALAQASGDKGAAMLVDAHPEPRPVLPGGVRPDRLARTAA